MKIRLSLKKCALWFMGIIIVCGLLGSAAVVMLFYWASRDLPDLERFLGDINGYGETRTSIVFSTPIPLRGLARPEAG